MDVRILCFNIHKGSSWGIPKSTINQIKAQVLELQTDIVFFQEIYGNHFEFLTSEVWPYFSYGKNTVNKRNHYGNAILSKYPIIYSKNIDISMHRFEHRGMLHCIIQIPGKYQQLHLICVHLGLFEKDRRKQLDMIVNYIEEHIPAHEPLILGGDFNDWSGYATIPLIKDIGLHEAFLNSLGTYANTFPAWAPVLKLDRVYFRGLNLHHAARLIQKSWRLLSDHIALEAYLKLI